MVAWLRLERQTTRRMALAQVGKNVLGVVDKALAFGFMTGDTGDSRCVRRKDQHWRTLMGFTEQGDDVGARPGRCHKTDVERALNCGIKAEITRDQRAIRAVARLSFRFNVSRMQHKQDVSVHGDAFGKLLADASPRPPV